MTSAWIRSVRKSASGFIGREVVDGALYLTTDSKTPMMYVSDAGVYAREDLLNQILVNVVNRAVEDFLTCEKCGTCECFVRDRHACEALHVQGVMES